MPAEPLVEMTIRLPESQAEQVKQIAQQEERSQNAVVRRLVRQALAQQAPSSGPQVAR